MKPITPYLIAEMACSHDGQPDLARQIIDGAGQAGASAIQFQIWKLSELMVPGHQDFKTVSAIELTRDQWAGLADYVRSRYPEMEIIACVYEQGSVEFCEKIGVDAYKIHSSDLSNPLLVSCVADTSRRIDLSVGASTLDEIQAALNWIRERSSAEIWLMYGIQNFPTPTAEVHLDFLKTLGELFQLPVGYQDHTDAESPAAYWLPAYAMGLGIWIQEKHITHNRALKGFDHQAALNPDEFRVLMEMVRTLQEAKGNPTPKPFSAEEIKYRKYSKKSLVAACDLKKDHLLTEKDLLAMRAAELGLPPDQNHFLVGRRLKHPIKKYQIIQGEDIS